MRPTTGSISRLRQVALSRLDRLAVLASPLESQIGPADRRLLSYLAIEAASLWSEFSRSLFLSCALGAKDESGALIVSSPVSEIDDALTLAVHAVKPHLRGTNKAWSRRDLPDFKNKGRLTETLQYVEASIAADVEAALSYQTRVLTDLPTMRNYFAHKAETAGASARKLAPRYGLSTSLRPEQLLCTVPRSGGGDILLREWIADLTAILGLMP